MAAVTAVWAPDWPEPSGGAPARAAARAEVLALAGKADVLSKRAYAAEFPGFVKAWERTGADIPRYKFCPEDMGGELSDACGLAVARAAAAGAPADALAVVERFAGALASGAFGSQWEMEEAARAAMREIAGDTTGGPDA